MTLKIKVSSDFPTDNVRPIVKEYVTRSMPFERHMFTHLGELRPEVSTFFDRKTGIIYASVKND